MSNLNPNLTIECTVTAPELPRVYDGRSTVKFINNNGEVSYLAGSNARVEFEWADGSTITVSLAADISHTIEVEGSHSLILTAETGRHIKMELDQ